MNNQFKTIAAAAFLSALGAQASAVTVASYTGTYDEATGVEAGGDYNNIGPNLGAPNEVGDFNLVAGVNTFHGSIYTPNDSADVFNIVVGANQTLTGATLSFATNANAYNPYFGFPSPTWGLYESSVTPTVFEFKIPDSNGATSGFSSIQSFTRGPGFYNMLIGNGTFGMNNGGGVDYTMTFTVTEITPPPPPPTATVPLPAGLPLLVSALGLMAGLRRRRG